MALRKKILVVDDERDLVDLIAYNLESEGFSIVRAYDGSQALAMAVGEKPDLVILDLMLPRMSGMEVCKVLRARQGRQVTPIIMLTARSSHEDRILGLEAGADDYVSKPFNTRELIARVWAVLRRSETVDAMGEADTFTLQGLRIDYKSYKVTVDGMPVEIGPMESKLLHFFSQHPGRVYSRDQLLDNIWGKETAVEPRTVDAHISRLRTAIEKDKENPKYILTVRGIGYKFTETR